MLVWLVRTMEGVEVWGHAPTFAEMLAYLRAKLAAGYKLNEITFSWAAPVLVKD